MKGSAATVVEETVSGECHLPGGTVALAVTVRLETPGEPCAPLSTLLHVEHEPGLPEAARTTLDDRLYDGAHAGFAATEGPVPPEGVRIVVTALSARPPLTTLLAGDGRARIVAALGDCLAELTREAVERGWRQVMPR
jgi:hypothetical protein